MPLRAPAPSKAAPLPPSPTATSALAVLLLVLGAGAGAGGPCGQSGMFACASGDLCIVQDKNCNDVYDCPDRSDEANCTDVYDNHFYNHLYQKRPHAELEGQCVLEQVPAVCDCKDRVLLCQYAGLLAPPPDLPSEGLVSLDLSGNLFPELDQQLLKPVPDVNKLVLSYCGIRILKPGTFVNRTWLQTLHLNYNGLTELPEPIFPPENNLYQLELGHNFLHRIPVGAFLHLRNLSVLDLRHNRLTVINREAFAPLESLAVLYLNGNLLEALGPRALPPLRRLHTLSLARNRLSALAPAAFASLRRLSLLFLFNNQLTHLANGTFFNLKHLRGLKLNANQLHTLEPGAFRGLKVLYSLDLQDNKLKELDHHLLAHLVHLQYVYLDDFRLCAAARHVRVCEPHSDGISSLDHLLDSPLLRASVWAMALVACCGNALVLVGRGRLLLRGEPNAVHSLYIMNLALADLLMGCYLFAIAAADWRFRGRYVLVEAEWRRSDACSFCGVVSTASAQASVLILALITWDRLASVARPLAGRRRGQPSVRAAAARAVALWAAATAAAAMPLSHAPLFGAHFYGGNGVCLPLRIHDPYAQGWEYSTALFVVVYALGLAFVSAAYWHMLRTIRSSGLALRSTQERRDRAVAQRFALIVLTDCACWAPVILVQLLALAGVRVQQHLYAWLAVCVMPVNSALNPVLYTLTTHVFKQQAARLLCAWRGCGAPSALELREGRGGGGAGRGGGDGGGGGGGGGAGGGGEGGGGCLRVGATLANGAGRTHMARTTGSTTLHSCSSWKSSQNSQRSQRSVRSQGATARATRL